MSDSGKSSLFDKCLNSSRTKCLYFGAILVLLVLVVFLLSGFGKKERLVGEGLGVLGNTGGQTSGATQRHATELTATNQQDRTTVLTADVAELAPGLSQVGRAVDIYYEPEMKPERLVNERGEPDFWEIGSTLDAYRRSQVSGMAADAAAKREHLGGDINMQTIARMENDQLAQLL